MLRGKRREIPVIISRINPFNTDFYQFNYIVNFILNNARKTSKINPNTNRFDSDGHLHRTITKIKANPQIPMIPRINLSPESEQSRRAVRCEVRSLSSFAQCSGSNPTNTKYCRLRFRLVHDSVKGGIGICLPEREEKLVKRKKGRVSIKVPGKLSFLFCRGKVSGQIDFDFAKRMGLCF